MLLHLTCCTSVNDFSLESRSQRCQEAKIHKLVISQKVLSFDKIRYEVQTCWYDKLMLILFSHEINI